MPKITILRNGKTYEVAAGSNFLEFCQDQDVPHDFGCTVGSCGTCVLVLEKGAENVSPASPEEKETIEMCTSVKGARLGCQMKVVGDVTVRALD
jgi:ferredoxin